MRLLHQQQRPQRLASARRTLSLAGAAAAVALVGLLLLAGTFPQARAAGESTLLPNLVADPPDGMILETSTIEGSTHLLLRFNGYVHNTGPGAVDFRGSREKPQIKGKSEKELQEEIESYKARGESLPQGLEEELAVPPMKLFQRLYTTNEGNPAESEKYLERPHVEEAERRRNVLRQCRRPSPLAFAARRQVLAVECRQERRSGAGAEGRLLLGGQPTRGNERRSLDGRVRGQRAAVSATSASSFEPNATGVYEGISPGWRDVYNRELAFQWVDASNVLPGEYWLREDVNATGVVKEAGGGKRPSIPTSPTIIPGFDALAQTVEHARPAKRPRVTLTSKAWNDTADAEVHDRLQTRARDARRGRRQSGHLHARSRLHGSRLVHLLRGGPQQRVPAQPRRRHRIDRSSCRQRQDSACG